LSQRLLQHPHCESGLPDDNWEQLKQCIVEAAEECVGRAGKKQPDWFLDAVDALMPLVAAKQSTQQVSTIPYHCCQEGSQKATEGFEEGGG